MATNLNTRFSKLTIEVAKVCAMSARIISTVIYADSKRNFSNNLSTIISKHNQL